MSAQVNEIYHYLVVSPLLSLAGQPSAEQLRAAAEEGFRAVINLATHNPDFPPQQEAELARALGLEYIHIPVNWNDPQGADFTAFEQAMQYCAAIKTLLHCAANFRATAFYSLYAMKHLGWTAGQALEFRNVIWQGSDYPVWEKFITDRVKELRGN